MRYGRHHHSSIICEQPQDIVKPSYLTFIPNRTARRIGKEGSQARTTRIRIVVTS
jgi:hypothetical protein